MAAFFHFDFDFALKLGGIGISLIAIGILWNVLQQIFFRNTHEPPVVFHWVPVIGSTITYGIDPLKFFAQCQAKVPYQPFSPIYLCCNL